MTLTPIACYFANTNRIDATGYLFAEFFAANIWSAALYIGNPTNIIAAQAFQLNFFTYSYWCALPTLGAGNFQSHS